jgi:NADPH:quinone reductase-like Zn-dependent oxidoreductase
VLRFVEEPLRDAAGGEARIRVEACGVLLADVMWQQGAVPGGPKPPFTPGYDLVGLVDQVGPGVEGVGVGDRVAAMVRFGGYTEYAFVSSETVVPVPEGLDPAEVVCLTVGYVTAYQIFTRVGDLNPGQRVLIHGAGGGTGSAMLDVARLLGLEAYGTASVGKHDLVRQLGGVPIDYRNQGSVTRIMELTGDGVDLVVDPIGRENLDRPFRTLRNGGQLVSTAALSKMMGDMTTIRVLMGLLQLQPARRAQELLLGGIVQEKLLRIPSRAEPATTPNPGPKPRDHATPERSLRPALSVLW